MCNSFVNLLISIFLLNSCEIAVFSHGFLLYFMHEKRSQEIFPKQCCQEQYTKIIMLRNNQPTSKFATRLSMWRDFQIVAPLFIGLTVWPLPVDCKIFTYSQQRKNQNINHKFCNTLSHLRR